MTMKKMMLALTACASLTMLAVPAFADDAKKPSFPMPAAAYKQHVDAKQAKMREHVEKRLSQLPADEAKEKRAKLDAKLAAMNAEVAKATADGTVTADEAKAVRAAGGHGGGCEGRHQKK